MSPATMDGFPRNATRSAPYPIRMQIFSSSGSRCAHRLEGIHRITAKSGGDGVGKVPEIVLSLSLLGVGEEEGRTERSLLSGVLGREQAKQTVLHL